MTKPNLKVIFSTGGDADDKVKFQYDENTNDLYVNDKKLMTKIDFTISEKVLAYVVAISVFVQAVMSVLTYLK